MDYSPKYPQPFTFAQACQLEIPTITKEISRLENSLFHLNRTQEELRENLSGSQQDSEDQDLVSIIRENEAVIASQRERITMLKLALEEQGINASSSRYNYVEDNSGVGNEAASPGQGHSIERDSRSAQHEETDRTDEGVYL